VVAFTLIKTCLMVDSGQVDGLQANFDDGTSNVLAERKPGPGSEMALTSALPWLLFFIG
jgi:hypothetical protein